MPPADFLSVFNAQPGATLLLAPDLRIVAASDDYLTATLTQRATLVGQFIFDAFPDNPQATEAHAVANVRTSLAQVLATRRPHEMAPQHYDVPDPAEPGRFLERYWRPRHTPVLDAAGQVQFIIQSVQDITASRRAERLLRESQVAEQEARAVAEQQRADFQHFIEEAPVAVAVYRGPQFHIELANATSLAIWDRPLDAVLDRPLFEVLPEAATPEFLALFEHVFTTGTPHTFHEQPTTINRHGRPEVVYWNVVLLPQHGPDGHIRGLITVGTDVTAQVQARQLAGQLTQELETRVQARTQEALALQADLLVAAQQQADQQAQLYQVFEQTPALIALLRAPGHRVEYVNPAYQSVFPGRTLVGVDLAVAVPELVEQGFISVLDRVYQTGEPDTVTDAPFTVVPALDLPARTAYFNIAYQAYRDKGHVAGVSIFAFDVTEQVLARQERESQRRQLHALFMEAPAPIVILDGPTLVFQLVNPAYQRIFPSRVLLGKPIREALPELVGAPILDQLQRVYDTGEPYVEKELPLMLARHDKGLLEEMVFTFTYHARRNTRGEIDGVMAFAHEVTDQVQARRVVEEGGARAHALAEELAESNAQLTRTNVDLDNFIYTASHDLKVPIANIEGLLQLLARKLPTASLIGNVPEMLELMQLSTVRFRRTIEQLTDVSRLQQEHGQPATQVLLAAVAEEVRLDLLPLIEQTQARLDVDVPADAHLPFSEKNLRSVVYNLLSNALKYRHPGRAPHVQLTYQRQEPYHVLRVQDNGLGFDVAKDAGKVFGMFQRLHTHTEGSGIGLYMVKKMVENGGGRIDVVSQPGEGTTFTVYIPVHPAP